MANKKLCLFLGLGLKLTAMTITKWSDLPVGGIRVDTTGNWTYNQTNANDFVLKNQIFFASSSAKLSINATISGDWSNLCGMIFCLDTQTNIVFNPGHLNFSINTEQATKTSTGLFQLKNKASLEINSNLSITATQTSRFDQGVFNIQDAKLHFINSDLSLDFSNNQDKINLFDLSQNADVKINSSGNSAQQTVILKGGIKVDNANFELNLSNRQSNFEGLVELKNASNFVLNLTNSQATLTHYNENLNGTGQASFNLKRSMLYAQLKGKQTDLNLSSSSIWYMFSSSEVRHLTLQDSQIDFMQDTQGNRLNQPFVQKMLQADSLKGNATFKLYADVQQKQIDTIQLQNAQGHHQIQIFYNPKTFTQALAEAINEQSNMIVASANNPDATFEAGKTEMGLIVYQTDLKKTTQNNQTQWVVSKIFASGYSTLSKILTTALNTPYRLFDLSNSILALRLGDLRNYPKDYGLYLRIATGLNQLKETANTLKMQESWIHLVGGFDRSYRYSQRTDFFGISFDVTSLDSKHPVFALNSQAYGIKLYYTSIFDHRFYLDWTLKYSFSPTHFQSNDNLDFQAHFIHFGLEMGDKFAIGGQKDFFYIQPEAKLTTGAILPLDFELKDQNQEQIKGKLQIQIPLIIRTALYVGYEWNTGLIGDFRIGSFVEYSLKNGAKTLLSDPRSSIEREFKSDLDVGFTAIGNIELNKIWRFYFGLDSSFLGNYTTSITFNAGMRWSFGDRYIPPPPINPSTSPDRLKIRYRPSPVRRTIPLIKQEEIQQMKHYDQKSIPSQQNRNKNRLYLNSSLRNPSIIEGQKEYNREIKRDRFLQSR